MANRNMKFWENFYSAIKRLPEERQGAFAMKILDFAFAGVEPDLDMAEGMAFDMMKPIIEKDMGDVKNGSGGGRPRKAKSSSETPQKTPAKTPCETPSETRPFYESETEGESEAETEVESEDAREARFVADALTAYNEESGQDVRELPGTCYADLRRIRDNGRTIEDVRRVVRTKRRQWEGDARMARYLRPSTIFKNFEEYVNEREVTEREPDFSDAVRPGDDAAF